MKIRLLALTVALCASSSSFAADTIYKVDTARSKILWSGSKVVGGSHNGQVKVKDGSVTADGDKVKGGEVVVDMASITDEDLKEAEWNQKLVTHLKSPDFFDVAKYPTAKLTVTSAESKKAGEYTVNGTLAIKDKTKPVVFQAKQTADKDAKVVTGDLVFDRTEFDIRYNSGKFFKDLGDKVIADEVKLKVELYLTPEGAKK